jgi:hypothetical protein
MKARALVARTDAVNQQTAANTAANQAATRKFMAELGNR